MEYNLLDRIMDEDNYGNTSAEFLLRNLTKAGQSKLIKDIARKTAFKRELDTGKKNFLSAKEYADELESRIRSMPENLQDSFLRTEGFNDNVMFNNLEEGFFEPETKETVLSYELGPHAYIHERAGHNTMDRLKKGKDRYIPAGFYTESQTVPHPDASVEENLAEAFHSDYGKFFTHGGQPWDKNRLYYILVDDIKRFKGFDKLSDFDKNRVMRNIIDNVGMDRKVKGFTLNGHDFDYQRGLEENARTHITPEGSIDEDKAVNAALSTEAAAHMAEMLATPNANEFVSLNFPEYRKKFLSIIDRDKDTPTPEKFIESHGKIKETDKVDDTPLERYRYFAFDDSGFPVGFRSKKKMFEFNDMESERSARNFMDRHGMFDERTGKNGRKLTLTESETDEILKDIKEGRRTRRTMFYVDKNGNMKRVIAKETDKE